MIEELNITGTHINYYFICKRKLYLFSRKIGFESFNENVKLGNLLHEYRYKPSGSKTIEIEGAEFDIVDNKYVIELKKSDACVDAAKWQLIFYLSIINKNDFEKTGKIIFSEKKYSELPGNQKTIIIEADKENLEKLEEIKKEIMKIIKSEKIPEIINEKKCKKCAYYEFCYV